MSPAVSGSQPGGVGTGAGRSGPGGAVDPAWWWHVPDPSRPAGLPGCPVARRRARRPRRCTGGRHPGPAPAYAGLGGWLDQQIESADAGLAFTIIGLQRRTMGSLLGYALDHRLWEQAQYIAQPLAIYWQARGLNAEADSWTDRVRLATEDHDGTAPLAGFPSGRFVGVLHRRPSQSAGGQSPPRPGRAHLPADPVQPPKPVRVASAASIACIRVPPARQRRLSAGAAG